MNDYANPGDAPAPQTTPTAKVVLRAFPTDTSLSGFVTALIQEASERLTRAARIASKLDSERPHDQNQLAHAGLGWKSNFTTRPLNTLVSRAIGRFPRAISAARYLTAASLPADLPNSRAKTEFFRDELTKALRSDPRWEDLVETLASENVTFGWCAAGWLDEDTWFPFAWQQDSMFVPVNTRQTSNTANAVVLKQSLLPSEAYQLLLNAQDADDGRWDLAMLAQAINKAMPENARSGEAEYERLRQELLRGLQNNCSYTGAQVVLLYHVLGQELSGKVSHYILDADRRLLFKHEDRFDGMLTSVVFFAFEKGDKTLMGSKGIGRMAYTMSSVIDRNRNDAVDRLQLSGKLIAQAASANHTRFKMSVIGNFILIDENFVLSQQKLEASPEASIDLDRYLGGLLDEMTGSVSDQTFEERERVTKAEVNARLGRENERSDDFLQRWLRQFGQLMSGIQYRLLNPNIPPGTPGYEASQTLLERLRTRLSDDEIDQLRRTPALTTIAGWTEFERMAIVAACVEGQGNPMYDQRELASAKVTAQVSPDFAQQVVLPQEDPTQVAEQTRTQLFENDLLLNGQEVPVSPRDAHLIHIQTMMGPLTQALQEAVQNPTADTLIQAFLTHGMGHLQAAKAGGETSPELAQAEQIFAQIAAEVQKMMQQEAKEQEDAALAAEEEAAIQGAVVSPPPPIDEPATQTAPLA